MGDGPSCTPPSSPLSPITASRQAAAFLRRPRSRGGARSARAQAATAKVLAQNHLATAEHARAAVTRGGRRRCRRSAASASASDTESDDWYDADEERRWGCCKTTYSELEILQIWPSVPQLLQLLDDHLLLEATCSTVVAMNAGHPDQRSALLTQSQKTTGQEPAAASSL